MQFIYTDPQTEFEHLFGGFHYINAFGPIESDDENKFKEFIANANPPPRTTIYIDSTGGDVDAAIGIGRLIRAGWHSTSIGRYHLSSTKSELPVIERELLNGKCLSAATLIYLGGRLRYFPDGAEFGVHQFSFKNPSPDDAIHSQVVSARIAQYIAEMEISLEFMEISSSTPSSKISIVSLEHLQKLGVVTGGETSVRWSVQARNQMIYVRGERDSLFGHHKVMLAYTKGSGFLFWGIIEAQGREQELTSLGLVEIVINGEETRLDISERCTRFVYGIYVHVLAKLSENEARLLAFSESFGVQVRFSNEAEMFLGIAAMSTNGGRDELETIFNCLSEEPASLSEPFNGNDRP